MRNAGGPTGQPLLSASVSRRQFLNLAALTAAGTALGACSPSGLSSVLPSATAAPTVGPSGTPGASTSFDWRRYAGTEINAVLTNNPEMESAKSRVPDFEALTGITVNFQDLELDAMREKQNVVFAAGSPEIDVWHTFPIREGIGFAEAGWYEDVQPFLDDPGLTAPEFDFSDLEQTLSLCRVDVRPGKKGIGGDGILVGMPLWWENWPLFYNKELLDRAGVSVPTTMDELETAAAEVHAPDAGVYGWATRGLSPLNTATSANIFFSLGAQWTDAQGRAALDTPEAANAIDWWARVMRNSGPPQGETLDVGPANDLFIGGKVAFYTDSSGFIGSSADPSISKVAGKFGITSWPAGPAGSVELIESWAACVSTFSTKKEAAWFYVQFLSGKEMGLEFAKSGDFPARASVRSSADYAKIVADIAPNLPEIEAQALKNGVTNAYPPISGVPAWRQYWGDALIRAVQGEDPKALAKEANVKLQALLDSSA